MCKNLNIAISVCFYQLLVNDNCVKWYRGIHPEASALQKVFTTDSVIIESFWCSFDDFSKTRDDNSEEKNLRCLCVREQVILTFFMDNGEIHYVPLPFMVSKTKNGVALVIT